MRPAAAADRTVHNLGRLDILVNNAAFQPHADSIEQLNLERLDETFRTAIYGYFHMATAAVPHLASGKVRVLGTFTTRRAFKDVPTMSEAGVKGLEVPVWVGVLAPAKTPADKLQKLGAEIQAICALPETRDRFDKIDADTTCGDSATFTRIVREDHERWAKVIKTGGISLK